MIRLNIWIKKKNIKLRIFSRPFVLKTDSWFFLIVIVWFEIKSFCMSIFFINLMQFTCLCSQYVIDIIKHDCQWCSFFFKKRGLQRYNSCEIWLIQYQSFLYICSVYCWMTIILFTIDSRCNTKHTDYV